MHMHFVASPLIIKIALGAQYTDVNDLNVLFE